jgi:hypothetical protein
VLVASGPRSENRFAPSDAETAALETDYYARYGSDGASTG